MSQDEKPAAKPPGAATEATEAKEAKEAKEAEPADDLVTTRHSITIEGTELAYTVTTGRMVLRLEGHTEDKFDGQQAKAEVFVTAYTADVEDATARPVTFAFNGGPGSASVWLHLGYIVK
jgi:carboxypeptidase C (cathepsin A)